MNNSVKSGSTRQLSPDEIEQIRGLREQFKPEISWKRLEDFGKWLFVSVAVVGTLGAGFSNISFQNLDGYGKYVFALAIIFVGISLACAVFGLAPRKVMIVPDSRDSMRQTLSQQVAYRHRVMKWATLFFASALVLAALAPFISSLKISQEQRQVFVTYSLKSDGKLEVQLAGRGLKPHSLIELGLNMEPHATSKVLLPRIRSNTDASGAVNIKFEPLDVRNKNKVFAVWHLADAPEQILETPLRR